MSEQSQFIDAESSHSSGGSDEQYNIKRITLERFWQCLRNRSVELRGGYWQHITSKNTSGISTTSKTYVPDTREEYCNSIDALYDCLLPKFDDIINENVKIILENLEEQRKKVIEATSAKEKEVLSSESYDDDDKLIIEEYKFSKLREYRALFQELSLLLSRLNYLDAGSLMA